MRTEAQQAQFSPEELAAQARAGSLQAFEQLVNLFHPRILQFLRQASPTTQDAEDAAQETFVKAYQSLSRYNSQYKFSTWLFTIAKRTAATQVRRQWQRSQQKPDLQPAEQIDHDDPAAQLQNKETHASLWQLARCLKPDHFELLWLRYAEDFEIADIAKITNRSSIHVKVLLHRARAILAKKVAAAGEPRY